MGGICIAIRGPNGLQGTVKERYQIFYPRLGLWIKYDAVTGREIARQKTKFKNVRVR